MDTRAKASELTTTGLLLAVSLVLCFVGVLFPTFGTYLKYLIPGMMAVIKTKYGYRYLTAFSLALLILVAVFFGIEQMVTGLFFVIPIGFALALVYEDNSIKPPFCSGDFRSDRCSFIGGCRGCFGYPLQRSLSGGSGKIRFDLWPCL